MMTTATPASNRTARPYGVAALGAAVLASVVAGVVTAVLALALDGSTGLIGALAGAGIALLVLATGFALVDMVSGLVPAFSMIFALLTYSFQVVVLAGVLAVLRSADDIDATLTPGWFAAGVIVVALAWSVCLVWHAMHARVPLYDLPGDSAVNAPPMASDVLAQGSKR